MLNEKQFENALKRLRKHIETKGYYENLGQKELRQYEDWLFSPKSGLMYPDACDKHQQAIRKVDTL